MPPRHCISASSSAWRKQAWHVLAVTVLHNIEELLTVRAALAQPPMADVLAGWGSTPDRTWSAFRLLNCAVSGAAATAVVVGVRQGRPELPGIVASTMLIDVAVPHVPAAVRAGGYAPGVATAVSLVLPVTTRHLLLSYRHGLLSSRELRRCLGVGLGLVVLGVPSGLIAAGQLMEVVHVRRTAVCASCSTRPDTPSA